MPISGCRSLTRLQAAAIHLAASLLGTSLVVAVTLLLWYPGELATLAGVPRILLLLVVVDVVLGPVITFVVFNTKKPELARDLLIVAAVQVAALVYGAHTVFVGRPVYLVFNAQQLDLVYATDISAENLGRGEASGFGRLPVLGPRVVAAVMPADPQLAAKIVAQALTGGDDLPYLPEHYRDVSDEKQRILAALHPMDQLRSANTRNPEELATLLTGFDGREVGFLPLQASGDKAVAVIDRKSAEVLAISLLNPGT